VGIAANAKYENRVLQFEVSAIKGILVKFGRFFADF